MNEEAPPFKYINGHQYDRAEEAKLEIDRGAGRDERTAARESLCLARVGNQFCGLREHSPDVPHQVPPYRDLRASDPVALKAQQEAIERDARAREAEAAKRKEPKKP